MKFLIRIIQILIAPLIALFGSFSLLGCPVYGPTFNFLISGTVMDAATSNAIQGIRVKLLEGTNTTDQELTDIHGNYSLSFMSNNNDDTLIIAEDIDGTNNGGQFQPATNSLGAVSASETNDFYLKQ